MLYVPIMKCKQGEKDALYMLRDEIKDQIVPLIEVTPDVISKNNFSGANDFWESRPFIFDVSPEYYEELTDEEYFTLLSKCDRQLVTPVVKIADSEEKLSRIGSESVNGAALRLYLEEILDDEFEVTYQEFTKKVDVTQIDLIIDVQQVEATKINETSFLIKGAVDLINNINDFRNVIFTSNSFPKSLDVERYELTTLPRLESKVFEKIKPHFAAKEISVVYSDYTINHWTYFEFILGIQPSFNIRYTTDNHYVIYKGDTNKKGGLKIAKVKEACEKLISSPYYFDKDYSWGDLQIHEKAKSITDKSGNLTTWRAIGANHHITFIVNLLSNQS